MKRRFNPQLVILFILTSSIGLHFKIHAQEIETVKIGTQEWTTKNLDVVMFQNGDVIPEAQIDADWKKADL